MEKKLKTYLIPSIGLFLVCLITGILLATVNSVTKERIRIQAEELESKARQAVLAEANDFVLIENKQWPSSELSEIKAVYQAKKDGQAVGYVVIAQTNGYAGSVQLICGLSLDQQITGVRILDANETPGLGAKASEPKFLDQYHGKGKPLTVYKAGDASATSDPNAIIAITSATITSKAVTGAVQLALEAFDAFVAH